MSTSPNPLLVWAKRNREEAKSYWFPMPVRYDEPSQSWIPVTQTWVDEVTAKLEDYLLQTMSDA